MTETVLTNRTLVRRLLLAGGLMAAVVSVVLAVPPLRGAGQQIADMQPGWLLAAVALEIASCASFAVVFRLFFDDVPGGVAREVSWVETGSGALLPGGGAGGLAIGGWLLHHAGISKGSIVRRSSGLFFLTSAASVFTLVGAGVVAVAGIVPDAHGVVLVDVPLAAGVVAVVAALLVPVIWRGRTGASGEIVEGISMARGALVRPHWRLLGAVGYLGFDIAVLAALFAATGHPLPLAPLALGYTLGYLGNMLPVPGGFGALEGGLVGALVAYGAPATQTAAAVIVYHAIAFWIPSLGGAVGYWFMRRRLGSPAPAAAAAVGAIQPLPAEPHRAAIPPARHGGRRHTAWPDRRVYQPEAGR